MFDTSLSMRTTLRMVEFLTHIARLGGAHRPVLFSNKEMRLILCLDRGSVNEVRRRATAMGLVDYRGFSRENGQGEISLSPSGRAMLRALYHQLAEVKEELK